MKKATQKAPVNLGSKRTCPKCSTRFYDLGREEVVCPKCEARLSQAELNARPKLVASPKKPIKQDKPVSEDPLLPVAGLPRAEGDLPESADDLGADDDGDVVEELDVEDKNDDETDY